ncbi:hypothetical protein D3C76_897120 [compost metagenome]
MRGGPVALGEGAAALQHDVHAQVGPGQLRRIADRRDDHAVAIYAETFGIVRDLAGEAPVHAVVLEQMGVDVRLAEVVDRHDLQVLAMAAGVQGSKDVAADAAETVDRQANGHGCRLFFMNVVKTIKFSLREKVNAL